MALGSGHLIARWGAYVKFRKNKFGCPHRYYKPKHSSSLHTFAALTVDAPLEAQAALRVHLLTPPVYYEQGSDKGKPLP